MKRRNIKIIISALLFGTTIIMSGYGIKNGEYAVYAETLPVKTFTAELAAQFKKGGKIDYLMTDSIIFVFHSDNRCDGSTDGTVAKLSSKKINSPIKMNVINDGQGWACEKKKASSYELTFDLRKRLSSWERFEVSGINTDKGTFYIEGEAGSDFMIVHFKKSENKYTVYKLEYRSEDPG